MLKNKIIVRKIRNIVILLMALIVMFGAYNNIRNSRAENVPSINAIVNDYYGLLEHDVLKLEATPIEGDLFDFNYRIIFNGRVVAEISKKVFSFTDNYYVDIEFENEAFIIALVVIIDNIIDKQKSN